MGTNLLQLSIIMDMKLILFVEKPQIRKEKELKNYIKIAGLFGLEDEEGEFAEVVKRGILKTIDRNWMDTLAAMDQMKEGIGLRGYGQKDPLQ